MTKFPSPVPNPGIGVTAPEISRDIYGMPAFVTILASDVEATVSWYTDGLGFVVLFTIPGPNGVPSVVHLRRWQFQDILVRPTSGEASSSSNAFYSFAAVYDEIDGIAERAHSHGGGRVDEPVDTMWNTRDVRTVDPDGNVVVFTAGRPPRLTDQEFTRQMEGWNEEQGLNR